MVPSPDDRRGLGAWAGSFIRSSPWVPEAKGEVWPSCAAFAGSRRGSGAAGTRRAVSSSGLSLRGLGQGNVGTCFLVSCLSAPLPPAGTSAGFCRPWPPGCKVLQARQGRVGEPDARGNGSGQHFVGGPLAVERTIPVVLITAILGGPQRKACVNCGFHT